MCRVSVSSGVGERGVSVSHVEGVSECVRPCRSCVSGIGVSVNECVDQIARSTSSLALGCYILLWCGVKGWSAPPTQGYPIEPLCSQQHWQHPSSNSFAIRCFLCLGVCNEMAFWCSCRGSLFVCYVASTNPSRSWVCSCTHAVASTIEI